MCIHCSNLTRGKRVVHKTKKWSSKCVVKRWTIILEVQNITTAEHAKVNMTCTGWKCMSSCFEWNDLPIVEMLKKWVKKQQASKSRWAKLSCNSSRPDMICLTQATADSQHTDHSAPYQGSFLFLDLTKRPREPEMGRERLFLLLCSKTSSNKRCDCSMVLGSTSQYRASQRRPHGL